MYAKRVHAAEEESRQYREQKQMLYEKRVHARGKTRERKTVARIGEDSRQHRKRRQRLYTKRVHAGEYKRRRQGLYAKRVHTGWKGST